MSCTLFVFFQALKKSHKIFLRFKVVIKTEKTNFRSGKVRSVNVLRAKKSENLNIFRFCCYKCQTALSSKIFQLRKF